MWLAWQLSRERSVERYKAIRHFDSFPAVEGLAGLFLVDFD
jgi:hypothetical protein